MPFDYMSQPEVKPIMVQKVQEPWRQALRVAARIIRERGHTTDQYFDPGSGAVCAYAAISLATGGWLCSGPLQMPGMAATGHEAQEKLEAFLGIPTTLFGICEWNNVQTSADSVIAAMEACAAA